MSQETPRNHYQNDVVYRPPLERESALLEVQLGCSYHQCGFCDFARDPFRMLPLEQIRENARELGQREKDKTTVFLLGQNAFCMKSETLLEIFDIIGEACPNIQQVNMYARADDILRKSPHQLAQLQAAGLGALHIGLESGSNRVLSLANKGVTAEDYLGAFRALERAGIFYHATYILGLGGRPLWREHVRDTTRLLNQIRPLSVWALALKLWPDTPYAQEAEAGRFEAMTYQEMLFEEKLILEQLRLQDCIYTDTTALGQYTLLGILPDGKAKLLQAIDKMLTGFSPDQMLEY